MESVKTHWVHILLKFSWMTQSASLPEIVAWRLLQEQELQQVIVHELLRRKLDERTSADAHKYVLDRRNLPTKPSDVSAVGDCNAVFTGIIGKGVFPTVAAEHRSVRTDKNGNLSIFPNAKASAKKQIGQKIKLNSNDKLRRDRLEEMLLAGQSCSADSISCVRKKNSPRKERKENLGTSTMLAPRRVLSLNLGPLVSSPAPEHHITANLRGSFTDRRKDDSSHFMISFSSARCVRRDANDTITTLDLKQNSSQNIAELGLKSPEMSEKLASYSSAISVGPQPHHLNSFLGEGFPHSDSPIRNSQSSKHVFPDSCRVSSILGSSAPPGFLHKVHSLRSILANPVSCHLPATIEHPTLHHYTHSQISESHQESTGVNDTWSALIAKYDSQILKPNAHKLH